MFVGGGDIPDAEARQDPACSARLLHRDGRYRFPHNFRTAKLEPKIRAPLLNRSKRKGWQNISYDHGRDVRHQRCYSFFEETRRETGRAKGRPKPDASGSRDVTVFPSTTNPRSETTP